MLGAGSVVEKKIDLYKVNIHYPEGCLFIVFPDLVRPMECSYLSIDVL